MAYTAVNPATDGQLSSSDPGGGRIGDCREHAQAYVQVSAQPFRIEPLPWCVSCPDEWGWPCDVAEARTQVLDQLRAEVEKDRTTTSRDETYDSGWDDAHVKVLQLLRLIEKAR